jgi:dihydrofolate reductase|tara:strand:+ start:142 stop:597 length:456 start_codon:yes stop_codon:yes gene_type:complete
MPKEVILIAAVTIDGYIARHSFEVTNWSKDLNLFKKQTMGHPVVVGSNTYKTLEKDLDGREVICVNRNSIPQEVVRSINKERCFIIGGGKTYSRFSSLLTHLYITPHPYVFNKGVQLFEGKIKELKLKFKNLIVVKKEQGVFQYQYEVIKT